jgi:DNA-binding LacI/PurR family transcriptional regulator
VFSLQVHFPQRSGFDLVGIDNFEAGGLAAEHLIKMRCQHLAFVTRPHSAATVDARIAGVREPLLRHGLEADSNWVQFGDPADVKFVGLLTAARRWDGFICTNDLTAAVLMRSLQNVDVNVPRDVRVVGFDDARYAALLGVPLTTIHQPCRDIALTAFRAMLERIAEPALPFRTLLLAPHLVVRESCGAIYPRNRCSRDRCSRHVPVC